MTSKNIVIRGARTHNLQNISVTIPRDKLVVITGLSGSGKSSLAFDTLYAEGQRRYVESLSSYARQFLSMMDKPDVDHIDGLSPAISIEQKTVSHNPRSTVGTVTEIYDYLRLLYARVGQPTCPTHHQALSSLTVAQMVDAVLRLPIGTKFFLLAPLVEKRKGEHQSVFSHLRAEGFIRVRVNGVVFLLEEVPRLSPQKQHTIEAVVDRMAVRVDSRVRLAQSLETALALSEGIVKIVPAVTGGVSGDNAAAPSFSPRVFSSRFACPACGFSVPALTPRHFSFNNPLGACATCKGLGMAEIFDPALIVARPQFSLSEGAVAGWDPQHAYYYSLLSGVAAHYDFDLSTPFEQLPERVQHIILYGSGQTKIRFKLASNFMRKGQSRRVKHVPFAGVIPTMTRRYRETESSLVREELGKYLRRQPCQGCQGGRLAPSFAHVQVHGTTLPQLCHQSIKASLDFFVGCQWTGQHAQIAAPIVTEIQSRLHFLMDVGLDYLTLHRSAETLSGGESQRIRLASQIGSGLVGVLYVLDEPTIGLHARDTTRLLKTLLRLRDLGNTVLMVEHDEEVMRAADHILDLGPGAGVQGGRLVGQGRVADLLASAQSITGQYLSGQRTIALPDKRVSPQADKMLTLHGVSLHNLQQVAVAFPLGLMICVTGVSGSGKSTLVNDTLYPLAAVKLNRALLPTPRHVQRVEGLALLDKVVAIDQSPIGRTPRSNPATYTGLFGPIRELFAATEEARSRGYAVGRFSFNVEGGRCAACRGEGLIKVEMHFLSDVYVVCDHCQGRRYNRETLDIRYKGQTIDAVLAMTVQEAVVFFDAIPVLKRKLNTLVEVGLSYIKLGQSATTLSGGEAQRLKLARELSKKATGSTLYILDEPTTGLHFEDVRQLLVVLHRLRDQGNTVIVIEHNLDVIKTADWLVDLGPGGGYHGGTVVATGTPEQLVTVADSLTGQYLKPLLA